MPLVPAICSQCGAQIEVDDTHEAGICKHCGTAFITEKVINDYTTNITNHIVNNNNFAGANVTIQSDAENVEHLMKRAMTFEKLNEFDKALKVYCEITSKFPMDYRGWLGIIICKTEGMTKVNFLDCAHKEMLNNFDKAIKVANLTEQENIIKQKSEYEEAYEKEVDKHENGKYNASICNLYDYRDVEKALGCKCVTSAAHTFDSFTFVLEHYVECSVSYMGVGFKNGEAKVERKYKFDISTCEKNVDRTNIEEILSVCRKKSENKGGCYIATCVYGSYDCPQVWTLRRFRDNTLKKKWCGRLFIRCYYAISPTLVRWFGKKKWFRGFWKYKLDKMVFNLNNRGVDNTYYRDAH